MRITGRVRAELGREVGLRSLFEAGTFADWCSAVASAPAVAATDVSIVDAADAPLSFAQEGLWFLHLADPDSPSYNIQALLRFAGPADPAAVRRALDVVMSRHDALRTTVTAVDGEGRQVLLDVAEPPLIEGVNADWAALRRKRRHGHLRWPTVHCGVRCC